MIEVYRIRTLSGGDNSHGVDRSETWTVVRDQTFETVEEARRYVIEQSIAHTELVLRRNNRDRESFYNDFCFDNDLFLTYRRFFIGRPPVAEIRRRLRENGVQVIELKENS